MREAEPGWRAGFTLLEMLVVLAVLALTASLLVERGPQRSPAIDARAAAGQVAQGLRAARAEAIRRDRTVPFALDVASGAMRIGDGPVQALPRGLAFTLATVVEQTAGSRLGAISFRPDGSSSGGRIGVAGGRARITIGVDWLTGRVSVTEAG